MSNKFKVTTIFSILGIFIFSWNCPAQGELGNFVIRTRDGYILVQNRPKTSFSIEFKGSKIEPMESDHPKFTIDARLMQVVVSAREQFWKSKAELKASPNDEELLESHKTWELDYVATAMNSKLAAASEFLEIAQKKKAMFWSFEVPKKVDPTLSHYLFLTTLIGDEVLGLNSAVATPDGQAACRVYMIEAMKTLKTSDKPIDARKLFESIGSNKIEE